MRRSPVGTSRPGAEALALSGQRSRSATGCALRATALRCSVRGRGAELTSFRCASLRSDRRAESVYEVRCAHRPQPCAARRYRCPAKASASAPGREVPTGDRRTSRSAVAKRTKPNLTAPHLRHRRNLRKCSAPQIGDEPKKTAARVALGGLRTLRGNCPESRRGEVAPSFAPDQRISAPAARPSGPCRARSSSVRCPSGSACARRRRS